MIVSLAAIPNCDLQGTGSRTKDGMWVGGRVSMEKGTKQANCTKIA